MSFLIPIGLLFLTVINNGKWSEISETKIDVAIVCVCLILVISVSKCTEMAWARSWEIFLRILVNFFCRDFWHFWPFFWPFWPFFRNFSFFLIKSIFLPYQCRRRNKILVWHERISTRMNVFQLSAHLIGWYVGNSRGEFPAS